MACVALLPCVAFLAGVAGLAGVGMSLGNFSTATGAMKLAVVYQRQVMAEEDKITGSNNGGW